MLEQAFQYLIAQVENGVEYPDAEFNAACKFDVPSEDLRQMYDDEQINHITRRGD